MAIDPRIRARRVAVRRAEGRRRLRFLGVAVGLVVVIVALWGLTRTALLDLDHVRIEGAQGAQAEQLEALAALERGTAMFDLDLGSAEAAIEAEPWIRSAIAERSWPGTVRINVVRRVAVAALDGPGGAFLVDEEGVVLAAAPVETDLPVVAWEVTAPLGGTEREALPAIAVARALPDDLRPWVDAVTMTPPTGAGSLALGLELIGAATVDLGDAGLVEDKLQAVRALLQRTELDCVDLIDVTVADLVTVTRDEACENARNGIEADDG